jgi:hypothetical protein
VVVPIIVNVGRAGGHAFRQVHRQQVAFLRANRLIVALWILFVAVLVAVAQALLPDPGRPYVAGAVIAAGALSLWFMSGAVNGSWSRWMGGIAEEQTHADLKRLRRHDFELFDAVLGYGFDIDHVAIGRGRVFAIEVKWSSRPRDLARPERDPVLQNDLYAARRGARRIRGVLKPAGVSTVTPVLVLRGPGAGASEERHTIGEVIVFVPPDTFDQPQVVARLRAYSEMRNRAEAARR